MKIVFTSIFRAGMGGGAGRVAHELARQFSKQHEVVIICPADQTGLNRAGDGLSIYGIRSAGESDFQMPRLSARTVGDLFDFLDSFQPDIVHAHEPALMGLIGQIWARMHSVPFVHTSHILPSKAIDFGTSDTINVPDSLIHNSISNFAIHQVLSNFFLNCDALIALNQSAYDSIREFGYNGPIYIIPNGRSLSHYNTSPYADNARDPKILVFIGYLSERKNQFYLLQVLRELPENYLLRLIGKPLSPEYQEKLDDYIAKHNLTNVEFIGQVDHTQIPAYLGSAHIFPSASVMEVQSLVVIEALASGTPVVGLSNETIDELVSEDVGAWLAKDQSPAAFAEQIQRICELPPEEYQRLCRNARRRIRHLDWSEVVSSTTEAYREILTLKLSVSDDESDMLTSLVKFFTLGDVRDYLLNVIAEARHGPAAERALLPKMKVPGGVRSWMKVPSSTWLLSGLTISVSVLGYLFMRGKGKNKAEEADS